MNLVASKSKFRQWQQPPRPLIDRGWRGVQFDLGKDGIVLKEEMGVHDRGVVETDGHAGDAHGHAAAAKDRKQEVTKGVTA